MSVQNLTGQTLGQYELRELLGAGGMGAVYRGYQPNLKRYVAVKVLSAQLLDQPGAVERFNREAQTSAALEHPHIIHIHDYGTQRGISYLVMQLLTGGSLSERIEQRAGTDQPLPSLGEIADLLKALASALDYAHSQGVIHRDIKPSNVMFDNHGQAYLVDFGIAKLVQATSGLTASGMVIGTWAYMAPEQWKAETLTGATDQYALAVMAYSLVTGQMPFDAPTPAGIMHKHLTEMPTPLHTRRSDAPEAVTQVIERALAKKQEDRFPTITAFAQAFDKAIRGQTGEVTNYFTAPIRRKPLPTAAVLTPSQPITAARPIYKHPAMWGMAALLVVALVVIALLVLGGGGTKKTEKPGTTAAAQNVTDTPTIPTPFPAETATSAAGIVFSSPTLSPTPQPSSMQTPSLTPTPTASHTAMPTVTPQPTVTPSPTRTPAPTDTPDLNATADALLAQHFTETAQAWTATPSPTATTVPTETPTPDLLATAEVMAAARMTATAEAYTDTPVPSITPTPTLAFTPTVTPPVALPLTKTFQAANGLAVSYPEDWVAAENHGNLDVANRQSVLDKLSAGGTFEFSPGEVVLAVSVFSSGTQGTPASSSLKDILSQITASSGSSVFGAITETQLGGKDAARASLSDAQGKFDGFISILRINADTIVYMAGVAYQGEFAANEPTLLAMAASLTYQAPQAVIPTTLPTATPPVALPLTKTFQAANGLTASYPEDWVAAEEHGNLDVANRQSVLDKLITGGTFEFSSGEIVLAVIIISPGTQGTPASSSLKEVLGQIAVSSGSSVFGTITETQLGGKNAALASVSDSQIKLEGFVAVFRGDADTLIYVVGATYPGEFAANEPTLLAIAASVTIQPPQTATPTLTAAASAAGQIAFASNRDDYSNSEIYVMNTDGSNPRRLTDNIAWDGFPAWQPVPKAGG